MNEKTTLKILVQRSILNILDTRDKRYMFLKIFFPETLAHVDIEGSPIHACTNIIVEIDKRDKIPTLVDILNDYFDAHIDPLAEL